MALPADPFGKIIGVWRELPLSPDPKLHRGYFVEDLTSSPAIPGPGPILSWWDACRLLAAGQAEDPDDAAFRTIWEEITSLQLRGGHHGGNSLWSAASLILACARALRGAGDDRPAPDAEWWRNLAGQQGAPLRPVLDIVAELISTPAQEQGRGPKGGEGKFLRLPVVLVGGQGGLSATLELQLFESSDEEFSPAAESMLVAQDGDFLGAFKDANEFLKSRHLWPRGCAVRWKLTFLDGKQRPLHGKSLGAALAFGTAWLAARHEKVTRSALADRLQSVRSPQRVCFSGAVLPDGRLDLIIHNGVAEKVQAAIRDERVELLILPESAIGGFGVHNLGGQWSRHAPSTVVSLRSAPNARPLTLVFSAHLFTV